MGNFTAVSPEESLLRWFEVLLGLHVHNNNKVHLPIIWMNLKSSNVSFIVPIVNLGPETYVWGIRKVIASEGVQSLKKENFRPYRVKISKPHSYCSQNGNFVLKSS